MKAYESGQAPPMPVKILDHDDMPVVAAVFLPGGPGTLDCHVVAYENHDDSLTVHYLVHPEDGGTPYLHQGSYDIPTYDEALQEIWRRVQLHRGPL